MEYMYPKNSVTKLSANEKVAICSLWTVCHCLCICVQYILQYNCECSLLYSLKKKTCLYY